MPRRTRSSPLRAAPQQARSQQTRERLLDVAGRLLGEVGVESITTNLICARAGMTPPALYRYFKDKYAVLEALGHRLMERQNAVLFAWLERHADDPAREERIEELLTATAEVTASEPGAVWTLRALRAVPQLAHVRIESHRLVTDRLCDAYRPSAPHLSRQALWRRLRICVEIGFAMDEMLNEEDRIPRRETLREASRMLRLAMSDLVPPPARAAKKNLTRRSQSPQRKRT